MDSLLSFPIELFHPLQHAGLSWRTPGCPSLGTKPAFGFLWNRGQHGPATEGRCYKTPTPVSLTSSTPP